MAQDSWSDVFSWPIIGVHSILMPDGRVLTFGTDQNGQQGGQHIFDVWDPVTSTHETLQHTVYTDIFCSAAMIVPETGEILIAGGDTRPFAAINNGVADVNVFDYRTTTLSPSPTGDMTYARWYPTAVTLANGKTLMLGGRDGDHAGVGTPELYTPGVGWKTLDGAASGLVAKDWSYPRAWLASDGRIVVLGSEGKAGKALIMDPSGDGRILGTYNTPFAENQTVPSIMFDEDKVLSLAKDGSVWISDFSGGSLKFTRTADAGGNRLWSNMTLLADGSVMLSGGSAVDTSAQGALGGINNVVKIWHPETGQWTVASEAAIPRLYHSTTLLLPDATVLSLGGGAPGPLTNLNGEIYKPAYLFDANGNLAERPEILDAPTELAQRQDFTITVDDPGSISRLMLIKYGAVTHSFNMEARKVDLNFTVANDGMLHVDLPNNSNIVTPGYWMLFAVNDKGTPSMAATIHIDTGGELYSSAAGAFLTLNGSAEYIAAWNSFKMTPNEKGAIGSLFSNEMISLDHNFSINFQINLGTQEAGAEGIAFVLHNDPNGGDAIGLGNAIEGATGISNGLAIEFDTWNKSATGAYLAHDFGSITDTDAAVKQSHALGKVDLGNLEDGKWHNVAVSWDAAAKTLTYIVDGKLAGTLTKDLAAAYFGGSHLVHFGFTAATGNSSNTQQVRLSSVTAHYEEPAPAHEPSGEPCNSEFSVAHLDHFVTLSGGARFNDVTGVATLTQNAKHKLGAMMSDVRLDVSHDFTIEFDVFLGRFDKGGDGLAFVLHNDPVGSRAIGTAGDGIGAYGIRNGLAIEFDTWNNGAQAGDIATDHTRFVDTDAPRAQSFVTGAVSLGNIENSYWHSVKVTWDAETHKLSYAFDGKTIATLTKDLADAYLGGSQFAHFGFTASTGGATNLQQVRVVSVDAVMEDGYTCNCDTAAPVLHLNGNASFKRVTGDMTLTPDAENQVGSVMSEDRIDLSHDFVITLDVFLGGRDAGGDGLAFVLHNDARGKSAIGTGGDGLGAFGIAHGLAIEFDTWNNGAANQDIAGDHTRFADTNSSKSQSPLTAAVNLGNIEDGKWHSVKVSWDAETHTLSYAFDGHLKGSMSAHLDEEYFGGSGYVHVGVTASTGGATNLHQVRFASVDAMFEGEDMGSGHSSHTDMIGMPV